MNMDALSRTPKNYIHIDRIVYLPNLFLAILIMRMATAVMKCHICVAVIIIQFSSLIIITKLKRILAYTDKKKYILFWLFL